MMDDALRAEVADEMEVPGSLLCDCDPDSSPPTRWKDRSKRMAHHCECAAVLVSAQLRRGLTPTLHERECEH